MIRKVDRRFLCVFIVLAACSRTPTYLEQIAAFRADKDHFMRESPESPVPANRRGEFPPLEYFPIDPASRVPATLKVARGEQIVMMPTSTGENRRMRRIGTLAFTLRGEPLTLGAFVEADQADLRRLFVPFGDLTNGTETYPGGRYLDLDRTATGIYDLDFNKAYQPFCFYNPKYDCPYPPAENRLKVAVRAGERR
jgi:uncharacterized protein (DUF1684 family)